MVGKWNTLIDIENLVQCLFYMWDTLYTMYRREHSIADTDSISHAYQNRAWVNSTLARGSFVRFSMPWHYILCVYTVYSTSTTTFLYWYYGFDFTLSPSNVYAVAILWKSSTFIIYMFIGPNLSPRVDVITQHDDYLDFVLCLEW